LLLLALADYQRDPREIPLDRDAVLVHVADDVEAVHELAGEPELLQGRPEGDHLSPELLLTDRHRDRGGQTHGVRRVADEVYDQPDREEFRLAEAPGARDREVALLHGGLQHAVRPRVPDEVRVSVRAPLRPEHHGDGLEVPAWPVAAQVALLPARHLLPEAGQLDVNRVGAPLPVHPVALEIARAWLADVVGRVI